MVLMLGALMLLSVSCRTSPAPEIEPIKIPLDWPAFPPPNEVVMAEGMVSMPLDYWLQITEYVVDIERLRKIVGDEILK
jgi:hypothetical protein